MAFTGTRNISFRRIPEVPVAEAAAAAGITVVADAVDAAATEEAEAEALTI
jgi:hypothetical protein